MIKVKDLVIDNMKVIDALWFPVKASSTFRTIGVVCIECMASGHRKMYIGPGMGITEVQDIQIIVRTGVPFYPAETAEWILSLMQEKPEDE